MTKTQKEKWIERLFGMASALIISLAIYSFTSAKDDGKELVKKVNTLDKDKASIEYVDKKCQETKSEINSKINSQDERLTRIEDNTQKIYDYLLNQKR